MSVYVCCVVSSDAFVTSEIRERLRQSSFDNWQWTDAQMIILLREIFTELDLLSRCHIDVHSVFLLHFMFEPFMNLES